MPLWIIPLFQETRQGKGEKLQTILHSKEMSKQDLSANVRLYKGCLYSYNSEGFPFTNKPIRDQFQSTEI